MSVDPSEQPLLVFVSSMISEMSDERKVTRQEIERIPLTKPWLFEFTPPSSEKLDESYLNKVKECDIFILLIGKFISPPVINEFKLAQKSKKSCLVFLKDREHDKDTLSFIEDIKFKWGKFSNADELAKLVQLALIDELIKGYRERRYKKLSTEQMLILVSIRDLIESSQPREKIESSSGSPSKVIAPAISAFPLNTTWDLRAKGNKLYDDGKFEEAIKIYSQSIFLDPNNAPAFHSRANCYEELGLFDSAIFDYKKAISLDPKDAMCLRNLAAAYESLKRYDDAIKTCEQAIELDPNSPVAYLRRGEALINNQRVDSGKEDIRTAIELINKKLSSSSSRGYYIFRGDAYYSLGEYNKALEDYKKAIEVVPDFPSAYYKLGICYKALGYQYDAYQAFEKCISLGESYHAKLAKRQMQ